MSSDSTELSDQISDLLKLRREIRTLNNLLKSALDEKNHMRKERDEARRELAELKARRCENCRLAPGCSYCVEGCQSCSEWEAKPEEK